MGAGRVGLLAFPQQFEIYLVALDPTQGSEIKKTRPCLIVSPDEMNRHIRTVIIAPISSKIHDYPSRLRFELKGKKAQIILDQLRSVDKSRLSKKWGKLSPALSLKTLNILTELFKPSAALMKSL